MRVLCSLLVAAAVLCGTVATAQAQGSPGDKAPPKTKKKFDRVAFIKLRIQFHRTMADLLEERIAEEPNEEKIAELEKEIDKLHKQMREMRPPKQGRPGARGERGQGRGGPGGPGGDRPGMGPGRGPGMGPPDWDDEGDDRRPPPRRRGGRGNRD